MHNWLKASPARVTVTVMGVAGSAASVVAMAGDTVRMYANSLMMIHGSRVVDPDGEDSQAPEAAAQKAAFDATLLATYQARATNPEAVPAMLQTDTWLTPAEAVAAGFADEILPLSALKDDEDEDEEDDTYAHAGLLAMACGFGIPADKAKAVLSAHSQTKTPPSHAPSKTPPSPPFSGGEQAVGLTDSPPEKGGCPKGGGVADSAPDKPKGGGVTNTVGVINTLRTLCADAGLSDYAPALALDPTIKTEAHMREAIAQAAEIVALAQLVGLPDHAKPLIESRATLDAARATLAEARAQAAEAAPSCGIPPTPPPVPAQKAAMALWERFFTRTNPNPQP
jgi:hypothetical protein